MKQPVRRKLMRWKSALSVLLAAVLMTSPFGMGSIAAYALENEQAFDIGVSPESVTAKLDQNGTITISGVGEIKDYTPETAPFQSVSQQITAVELGSGVTSIGSYLFFDCQNLRGTVEIPEKLVRIGDRAFSGSSPETAPDLDFVINRFTEADIIKNKETASLQEESKLAEASPKAEKEPVSSFPKNVQETPKPAMGTRQAEPVSSAASKPEAEGTSEPWEKAEGESSAVSQAPGAAPSPAAPPIASPSPDITPKPSPSPSPEVDSGDKFQIETITEQEIGREIFFPREENEKRFFTGAPDNRSFHEAMKAAGYQEAERLVSAAFDCGEGTSATGSAVVRPLPQVDGNLLLPPVLNEFAAPEGGDLLSYSFGGWTESKDEAGIVRPMGSYYETRSRDDLYFIANWDREVLIKIQVERADNILKLTIPDIEGYDITGIRWQTCFLEVGEEPPLDEESLSWSDLDGKTEKSYHHQLEKGDENRLFRCVVTVAKQSLLRSIFGLGEQEELALSAVQGAEAESAQGAYLLKFAKEPESYAGAVISGYMPDVAVDTGDYAIMPFCEYTAASGGTSAVVFNGWLGSDGKTYHPGDTFQMSGNLTLTAQWDTANLVYVDPVKGADWSADGSKSKPYKNLYNAGKSTVMKTEAEGGTVYNNRIIVLPGSLDWSHSWGELGNTNRPCTVTGQDVDGSFYNPVVRFSTLHKLSADTAIENLHMTGATLSSSGQDGIYANGYRLIFGQGNITDSKDMLLYGGVPNAAVANPFIRVFSGKFRRIIGGSHSSASDAPAVQIGGTAEVEEVFGGSLAPWGSSGVDTNGNPAVTMTGGTVGTLYGGGYNGNVTGTVSVQILGGTVTGDVYVGGSEGAVQGAGTSQLVLQGGTVSGNVYGGAKNGNVSGSSELSVGKGAMVAGNVYGGGDQGNIGGGASVSISGGAVGGSVYGGGNQGKVGLGTEVIISAGTVSGNVYGGGRGKEGSPEVGEVTGNTAVTITGGILGSYSGVAGEIFDTATGNVYGGGEFARVAAPAGGAGGSSSVVLNAEGTPTGRPTVGGNLYGGGSKAEVAEKSSVRLDSGRVGRNIYGAGFGAASTVKNSRTEVNGGSLGEDVYGGGEEGTVSFGSTVIVSGGAMRNIFGAGQGNVSTDVGTGRVGKASSVTLSGGTVADSVYGGGNIGLVGSGWNAEADAGVLDGQTEVTVTGGTAGNVFGGGSGASSDATFGAVFGHTSVAVRGGSVSGSIYGGGNYGKVLGNTEISMIPETSAVSVGDSVFGGGNLNRSPEDGFDDSSYLVMGNSSLLLDGSGADLTIGGSVFGSGNLTKVFGKKQVKILNYHGMIQSIQRTSQTDIANSEIALAGSDDITDDQGGKLFSMTKVDNLRLNASTLCLKAEARELGALGNYDASWNVSTEEAGRSTLRALPGLLLQIKPSVEAGGTNGQYGPVSGVFWLDMSEYATNGRGVRIEAAENSEIGDGSTNTGAFLKKNTPENEGSELVSGSIPGSCVFWRLGGNVLERSVTLMAPHTGAGGQKVVSQSFQIPTSVGKTIYKITKLKKVSGAFQLVKAEEDPQGAMTLPAFGAGQSADNTFSLKLFPSDTNHTGTWVDLGDGSSASWGLYALTQLPLGETAWNSGVEGIWKRGTSYPTTAEIGSGSGNNAEFTFSMVYDSTYESFSGGELEFTLQEFEDGSGQGEAKNTVLVKLTLEGETGGFSQAAYVERGRKFAELSSKAPVTLTEEGAVTALVATSYFPKAAGSSHMYLNLCSKSGEAAVPVAFPEGTQIVLADMSAGGNCQYYFCRTLGTQEKLSLAGFTNGSGSGSITYPGPSNITARISEKLLFAVDFSGVAQEKRLKPGDYFLTLTHTVEEAPQTAAPAEFSIEMGHAPTLELVKNEGESSASLLSLTFTPKVSSADTRYADGVGLRVTLKDTQGTERGFPSKVVIGGPVLNILRDGDGTVSFGIPKDSASTVTFDFSQVPESMFASGNYQVNVEMRPRTGLQIGSNQGEADAKPPSVGVVLDRTPEAQRAILVSLKEGSERLLDTSLDVAHLEFSLTAALESGDHLKAEVFRKDGATPQASSYTLISDGETWFSLGTFSGEKAEAVLTVPKGTTGGTYRARFSVVDSNGSVKAEQPYNFIIK